MADEDCQSQILSRSHEFVTDVQDKADVAHRDFQEFERWKENMKCGKWWIFMLFDVNPYGIKERWNLGSG